MKGNEPKEKWLFKIYKLLILEIKSEHGRVNAFGVIMLILFILFYCTCNWFTFLVSNVVDVIKTCYLKTDINYANEGPSFLSVVIPILIGLGMCLLFLYFQEKRKDEIRLKEQELNKSK